MASVKVTCPACKAGLQIGPDLLGKAIKCPKCKKPFKAPAAASSPAAAAPKAAAKPAAAPKPPARDANKYVVSRAGKKFGPYTMAQLKQLVEMGKLKPDDELKKGADGDWESASNITGLFPEPEESAEEEENLFGDDEEDAPAPVRAKTPIKKPAISDDEEAAFGDDEEEEAAAPRGKSKPAARRPVDDDDEEEEDAEPPKKKKGSFALVLVLLLLVLAGGGGAAWWFLLGPGAEPANTVAKGKGPSNPVVTPDAKKPNADDSAPKGDAVGKNDDAAKDSGTKDTPKGDDGKKDDPKTDAGEKKDDGAKKDPETKQPVAGDGLELKFLSNDIQGIAVVNVQRILNSPLAKNLDAINMIRKKLPADEEVDPTKIDRFVFYVEPVPAGKYPASGGFLLRFTEPMDAGKVLDKNAEETMFEGKKGWKAKWEGLDIYIVSHDEKTYVGGVEGTLKKMLAGGDAGALRTKLAATNLNSADILLVGVLDSPNQDAVPLRKMLEEAAMNLPEQFKDLEPVVPKLKAASVALDLSGKNLLTATVDLDDAEAAGTLKKVANDALGFAKFALAPTAKKAVEDKAPPEVKTLAASTVDELFNGMAVEQKSKSVVATIPNPKSLAELIKVGAPLMMKQMAGGAKDAVQMNNMRQVVLALHGFHDTHKKFPSHDGGAIDPKKKVLSWRVAILPFVEEMKSSKNSRPTKRGTVPAA